MSSILYSPVQAYIDLVPRLLTSPLLAGPLLAAATWAPKETQDTLINVLKKLPGQLETSAFATDLSVAKTVLKVLLALGVLRYANQFLNTMAHNAWRIGKAPGWDWPKEIAVITGGSSGIGKTIVEKLVLMKVRVAILDIQEPPKSLQAEPLVRYYKCDITSSESVAEAADALRKELGHPTILINNAGVTKKTPILKMPETMIRRVFNVNVISNWFTVQQFLPRMIQLNKGHIVTVASLASFVALPTAADYGASKAAVLAFHESLTCELKHCYKSPNVMTTVVHPNFVRTPLVEDFAAELDKGGVKWLTTDQVADKVVDQVKSRRGGQVIIPETTYIVSGIRGWPTWLQEVLRDMLGRTSVNGDA